MKIFDGVTRKDLVYIILMLFIVLIAVSANFLGNDDAANSNINFAATIVSIILGLIAILYTLMDSTGQKESIATLINVSSKLEKQINLFEESIEKSIETSSQIEILRQEIEKNNEKLFVSFEKLSNKVDSGDIPEVREEIKRIGKQLEKNNSRTLSSYGIDTKFNFTPIGENTSYHSVIDDLLKNKDK